MLLLQVTLGDLSYILLSVWEIGLLNIVCISFIPYLYHLANHSMSLII